MNSFVFFTCPALLLLRRYSARLKCLYAWYLSNECAFQSSQSSYVGGGATFLSRKICYNWLNRIISDFAGLWYQGPLVSFLHSRMVMHSINYQVFFFWQTGNETSDLDLLEFIDALVLLKMVHNISSQQHRRRLPCCGSPKVCSQQWGFYS